VIGIGVGERKRKLLADGNFFGGEKGIKSRSFAPLAPRTLSAGGPQACGAQDDTRCGEDKDCGDDKGCGDDSAGEKIVQKRRRVLRRIRVQKK
jgi:hypothetical protein